MGIEFNSNNLNAAKIYEVLDAQDTCVGGKQGDGQISASLWNIFAKNAGGNSIKNYIKKDNAIAAINRYLQKASAEIKNDIARFLNIQVADDGLEGEEAVYAQVDAIKKYGPNRFVRAKLESKDKLLNEYGTTKEELFGDNKMMLTLEPSKLSTTKEERLKLLKEKGTHGFTYVQAKAIVRDHKKVAASLTDENQKKEQGIRCARAYADIKELEEKFPNINECYVDLKHEYDNIRFDS